MRALFVIGPDGFITQDTDYPSTPRVSLADRPYFQAHEQDPDLGLHRTPAQKPVGEGLVHQFQPEDQPAGRQLRRYRGGCR